MKQVLRVLLVEDSEDDAFLILRELQRGDYEIQSTRVYTAAALEKALDDQGWDVIISDYVMPGFGGMDALAQCRARGLNAPFLMVSGRMGEENAVEAMLAGAQDYIMKHQMARLVPAVRRELREAATREARRQADLALRESEERFRQLAENTAVVFFMFERPELEKPGRVLYASPAYERLWERPLAGLQQDALAWVKGVHPVDRENVIAHLDDFYRGEFNQEFRLTGVQAGPRWIHLRAFPVFDSDGAVYRVAAIAEDISERKRADEQLAVATHRLDQMVQEMRAIDEELRTTNWQMVHHRVELEKRVRQRTADLAVANEELRWEIDERTRLEQDLLEIADQERQRIGLNLHDDLSQKLMGVSFLVKALERKVEHKHLPRINEARRITNLLHQVINHSPDRRAEFNRFEFQGEDLAAELRVLAGHARALLQISCRLVSKGAVHRVSAHVAAQVFKIVQEAVSNAAKHGQARLVLITVEWRTRRFVVRVKSNGVRFPGLGKLPGGVGLRIMHSRAGMIGATLDIRANGSSGALVTCTVPLAGRSQPPITQPDLTLFANAGRREGNILAATEAPAK